MLMHLDCFFVLGIGVMGDRCLAFWGSGEDGWLDFVSDVC